MSVQNYFNYFTEIEEHFQRRRGGILLLSTLDWALIETWKEAGLPLEAVLRGIDAAFDRYEKRPTPRKVNSLAYCAQEVLAAAEEMKEAAVGVAAVEGKCKPSSGFEQAEIVAFLRRNADQLEKSQLPQQKGISVQDLARQTAGTLRELASGIENSKTAPLEDLERRLSVLEEKLLSALVTATPDEEIVSVRADADRELVPYRRKMTAPQIEQLQKQYVHKRLLEKHGLPRLSLFYM